MGWQWLERRSTVFCVLVDILCHGYILLNMDMGVFGVGGCAMDRYWMAVVGKQKHVTAGTTASSTKCKASSQLAGRSTQGEDSTLPTGTEKLGE